MQLDGEQFLLQGLGSLTRPSVPLSGPRFTLRGPFELSNCRSQSAGFSWTGPLGSSKSMQGVV